MTETPEFQEPADDVDAPLPILQSFPASDGYEIAYRLWRPVRSPQTLVVALHGIQSHSGWYGHSSARLAAAGHAVAFLDRRGSGRNETSRGDTPHADRLISDVVQFVYELRRGGFEGIPIVLMAISWGGKLAAAVAARRAGLFDGLVLLAPGLCPQIGANAAQRLALKFAAAAGAGTREVAIPLDDAALFTDVPEYQAFIRDDPLALRRVTVRFLLASLDLDRLVQRSADAVRCPVLLMLAGRDRIIDNAATRRLVASFGSPEKTLLDYQDACHTLEFERDRHIFLADLIGWLDRVTNRHRH